MNSTFVFYVITYQPFLVKILFSFQLIMKKSTECSETLCFSLLYHKQVIFIFEIIRNTHLVKMSNSNIIFSSNRKIITTNEISVAYIFLQLFPYKLFLLVLLFGTWKFTFFIYFLVQRYLLYHFILKGKVFILLKGYMTRNKDHKTAVPKLFNCAAHLHYNVCTISCGPPANYTTNFYTNPYLQYMLTHTRA